MCPRDATPLEDAPVNDDPLVGTLVGESYEIVRVIGEGGMGRVYEARHARLHNKRYAVKLLHQDLARQPEVVTRFQREAEAASALSHPNVVGVYDVNATKDGQPFIVGELLEGVELGKYLDQIGKLTPQAAIRVVRQICQALGEAHRHGIVHRDMKPENVFLVGTESHVKVLDFGISKLAESSGSLTKTGMVMGTPGYMAPEQARGSRVDKRADVYAVGAILYRCVTGQAPFEGLDQMGTLAAVIASEPERPTILEPSLPPALELVIQRAMAKNPDERYATMEELDAELASFDPAMVSILPPPPDEARGLGKPSDAERRARAAPTVLAERSRDVRWARPGLAVTSVCALLWLGIGLVSAVIGVVELTSDTETKLTMAEVVLSSLGSLALMLTPTVLWARHVIRCWGSTPRVIELGRRAKSALLTAIVSYGVGALAVRFAVLMMRDAENNLPQHSIVMPAWAIILYLISVAAGSISWFASGRGLPRST